MTNTKRITTKELVLGAVFTAVLIVLSQLSIPLPSGVPITLQTFAVALCGYVLGWKLGLCSVGVYVLLGLAGVPVFSNFSGGAGVLFGMTGGFIFGFLAMAALCGVSVRFQNPAICIMLGLAGLLTCHLAGAVQFSLVTQNTVLQSFLIASVPYLIKDVLSVAGAYLVALAVRKGLAAAHLTGYASN